MHVLRAALLHEEDEMRLNALEMLCLHPKMTEPPTPGSLSQHILIKHTLIEDSEIERLKDARRCGELLRVPRIIACSLLSLRRRHQPRCLLRRQSSA